MKRYSVDFSVYFKSTNPALVKTVKIEDLKPQDPNLYFRVLELQTMGDGFWFLDMTWDLNAGSPASAEKFVAEKNNLAKVIPIPECLKIDHIALCSDGEPAVWDHHTQTWWDKKPAETQILTPLETPDLSHLNLRTQVVSVLYVMDCAGDFLDFIETFAEAAGKSYLLDLEDMAETETMPLDEIVSTARNNGFKTIIFTS